MTTSRLFIVFAILLGGLSSVFFLPKQLGFMPEGVNLAIPEYLGEWWGQNMKIQDKERAVLGMDTDFARKEYANARGDRILVSVVLSGQDMMTSIHRPERCLRAQGWDFQPGEIRTIDIPNHGKLPVMRLKNRKFEKGANGESIQIENICYYWFAGSKDVTASHLDRVKIDSIDRIKGGYVQRWAMTMIAADITGNRLKFGRNEKETDELLVQFIAKLAPQLHKDAIQYR